MCEDTRRSLRELAEILDPPRGQREETVYPKGKVHDFFTEDRIENLGKCACGQHGCCSQAQPPKTFSRETILEIRKKFTSALALLVSLERGLLIFEFINKGFNDEQLTRIPLTKQQLRELLDLSNSSGEPIEEFDVRKFHGFQNEFFLPQLSYESEHQSILSARSLPFSIKGKIGKGAYSTVYEAQMLHNYHDFPHAEDGRVAVKTYTDWSMGDEDSNKERENSKRWSSHDYITPIQASLDHREIYMTIWPLAEQDLQDFMKKDPPEEYLEDPSKAWKRFVNLLSALNYIHTGDETVYGYHFDIKPHNILVRFNGDWAITDLGIAYCKTNDSGTSETSRQGGNERYRAPEDRAHRNYDVWAMGCIGCEITVWLDGGARGVEKFRKARELQDNKTILDNFHHNGELKAAVADFFEEMERHENILTRKVAAILRKMLEINPIERLNAQAAEKMFREVLNMPQPQLSRRPSVQNSLSPIQPRPRSRRSSIGIIIPSERSNVKRSPLSASANLNAQFLSPDPAPLGDEAVNLPQIQVTIPDDREQPGLGGVVGTADSKVQPAENPRGPTRVPLLSMPSKNHRVKRVESESPVPTELDSSTHDPEQPKSQPNLGEIIRATDLKVQPVENSQSPTSGMPGEGHRAKQAELESPVSTGLDSSTHDPEQPKLRPNLGGIGATNLKVQPVENPRSPTRVSPLGMPNEDHEAKQVRPKPPVSTELDSSTHDPEQPKFQPNLGGIIKATNPKVRPVENPRSPTRVPPLSMPGEGHKVEQVESKSPVPTELDSSTHDPEQPKSQPNLGGIIKATDLKVQPVENSQIPTRMPPLGMPSEDHRAEQVGPESPVSIELDSSTHDPEQPKFQPNLGEIIDVTNLKVQPAGNPQSPTRAPLLGMPGEDHKAKQVEPESPASPELDSSTHDPEQPKFQPNLGGIIGAMGLKVQPAGNPRSPTRAPLLGMPGEDHEVKQVELGSPTSPELDSSTHDPEHPKFQLNLGGIIGAMGLKVRPVENPRSPTRVPLLGIPGEGHRAEQVGPGSPVSPELDNFNPPSIFESEDQRLGVFVLIFVFVFSSIYAWVIIGYGMNGKEVARG